MTRYRVRVDIIPRRGLLNPQGKAVADALHTLGFGGVGSVSIGRHIVIDADAPDERAALHSVREMCERLLANPVTEDFEVASVEPALS